MTKTVTTRYDIAEHLRTPEEMAAYLEACLEETDGDAAASSAAMKRARRWPRRACFGLDGWSGSYFAA